MIPEIVCRRKKAGCHKFTRLANLITWNDSCFITNLLTRQKNIAINLGEFQPWPRFNNNGRLSFFEAAVSICVTSSKNHQPARDLQRCCHVRVHN